MTDKRTTPTRWWYFIALLIFAAGVLVSLRVWSAGFAGLGKEVTRLSAPGTNAVVLTATGRYHIYSKGVGLVGTEASAAGPETPGLHCQVKSSETGAQAMLSPIFGASPPPGQTTSGLGFRISRPGVYEISAQYPREFLGPHVTLIMEHGLLLSLAKAILSGLAVLVGGGAAGVGIIAFVAAKRSRGKQQTRGRAEQG